MMETRICLSNTHYGMFISLESHIYTDQHLSARRVLIIDEVLQNAEARGVVFPSRWWSEREAEQHAGKRTTPIRLGTKADALAYAQAYAVKLGLPIDNNFG